MPYPCYTWAYFWASAGVSAYTFRHFLPQIPRELYEIQKKRHIVPSLSGMNWLTKRKQEAWLKIWGLPAISHIWKTILLKRWVKSNSKEPITGGRNHPVISVTCQIQWKSMVLQEISLPYSSDVEWIVNVLTWTVSFNCRQTLHRYKTRHIGTHKVKENSTKKELLVSKCIEWFCLILTFLRTAF